MVPSMKSVNYSRSHEWVVVLDHKVGLPNPDERLTKAFLEDLVSELCDEGWEVSAWR